MKNGYQHIVLDDYVDKGPEEYGSVPCKRTDLVWCMEGTDEDSGQPEDNLK